MSTRSRTDARPGRGPIPRVTIVHAYSPLNSGDGLLVDLTVRLIEEALGSADIRIVALNADAFKGGEYVQWGAGPRALPTRVSTLAAAILRPRRDVRDALSEADVVVAVGGGYMRGGSFTESVKSYAAHYAQLRAVTRHGNTAIYLPQSIGPYSEPYRGAVNRKLAKLHRVFVRDDRSLRELQHIGSVRRAPDLAVLALAGNSGSAPKQLGADAPIFVGRELSRPRNYYRLLSEIAQADFTWAVQSSASGNNDVPLTQRYGGTDAPPRLSELLGAAQSGRIVVSTRLHGSMAALMAGHPTVHLSYERKGWGAFEDLGLPEYVLNARDATLDQVLQLVTRVRENEARYWSKIEQNRARLSRVYEAVVSEVRAVSGEPAR